MRLPAALAVAAVAAAPALAPAGDVTVVFYNIKFLDAGNLPAPRKARLQAVVGQLNADAYGLCEVKDRQAVEAVFPPADWGILIDDDSNDLQDNAIVFRKSTMELLNGPADLDADDEHFLFPADSDDSPFPKRRDVLFADLREKASGQTFTMMVVHLKSRVGGRNATQFRRVAAAWKLVWTLEARYDGKPVVIGGDWNDNPDDRSLNILETGDPNAAFGPPSAGGTSFLVNLMEPLVTTGHVSHGKGVADIQPNGKINTIDPQSRQRNANGHGQDVNTGDILFDQILVSDTLNAFYKANSAAVFDGGIALEGGSEAASDHLPVLAKFAFPGGAGGGGQPAPAAGVRIAGLLPNPAGDDAGNEEVHLKNTGAAAVNLQGWLLMDKGGHVFNLTGQIPAGGTLPIRLPAGELPLNNTGDTVKLFDPNGTEVQVVSYTKQQATEGAVVTFN